MELLATAFKNHGVDDETVKELVKHFEEHKIGIPINMLSKKQIMKSSKSTTIPAIKSH